jgi:hypothetical protein
MACESILIQLLLTDEFVHFEALLNDITLSLSPKFSCVEVCHFREYKTDVDHKALVFNDLEALLVVDCREGV